MTFPSTKNSSPGLRSSSESLRHGSAWTVPVDTHRLDGPALPPNGIPTPTPSLEKLNERLERLAFGRRPAGHDSPPLETYTTTATANGDVVRATQDYVRWFHRTYPAAGPEDRARVSSPCPSPEGYGGATDLTVL